MAVPPSVPTSFVPRPQSSPARSQLDLGGAFAFLCYGVLFLVVVVAIGVFIYNGILSSERAAKDDQLKQAQAGIDPATVDSFVRLRNRLTGAKQLLDKHVALSPFFQELEKLTVANVRLTTLDISLLDNQATLKISGTASNFNALAAESVALSSDTGVKDAIFSGIKITNTGTVNFSLQGTIDPSLTAFSAGNPATLPASSAPITATSTTP